MSRRKPTKKKLTGSTRPTGKANFRPYLKYVGVFAVLMLLFQSLCLLPQAETFIGWMAVVYARMSVALLSLLGMEAHAAGATLLSGKTTILTVDHACSGIEFFAILFACVLAFPCGWKRKLIGLVSGAVVLAVLNTLRVASLYWVGVERPAVFHVMHENWWSVGLTLFTVCLLAAWMALASSRQEPEHATRAS